MRKRIGVAGACGRMGTGIIKAVSASDDMELVLATDIANIGSDIGDHVGIGALGVEIISPEKLNEKLKETKTEILVDFTSRDAVLKNSITALKSGVDIIIGTTGLTKTEIDDIKKVVRKNRTSAVISPNMATGVNLFFKLAADGARSLGREYDVEIIEAHHRHKKDAPSGTALRVGELVSKELGRDMERDAVYGRKGIVGERTTGEIGIHSIRAGDIVGEHTVIFAGEGERLEITHKAHSRDAFVRGVIKAIRFLGERKGGGEVYSTWDVLGIQ